MASRIYKFTVGIVAALATSALLACTKNGGGASGGGGSPEVDAQGDTASCMSVGDTAAFAISENADGVVGYWEEERNGSTDNSGEDSIHYLALSEAAGVRNIDGYLHSSVGCVNAYDGGRLENLSATSARAAVTDQMLQEARESGKVSPEIIEKAQREGLAVYSLESSGVLSVKSTLNNEEPRRYHRVKTSVAAPKIENFVRRFVDGKKLGSEFVLSLKGKSLRLVAKISETKDSSGKVISRYETPASEIQDAYESTINDVKVQVYTGKLIRFTGVDSAVVSGTANDKVLFTALDGKLSVSLIQNVGQKISTTTLSGYIEKTGTTVSITEVYSTAGATDQTQGTIYQYSIE